MDDLKSKLNSMKLKLANSQTTTKELRTQLKTSQKSEQRLTRQLLKLETDEKKRQKLIELRRHIEETMREDDL